MERPAEPPQDMQPGRPQSDGMGPLARLSAITGNATPRPGPVESDGAAPIQGASPTLSATPVSPSAHPGDGTLSLGRLRQVEAGALWPDDARFAAWLAENLDAVADATSLSLEAPQVLDGSTPVVLAAERSGQAAVVVPQRGRSTDEAFGALVRHMAASSAEHGVWICGEPASEHAAAVSWLNRAVNGRFVLVRAGAVTIGDSAAAPTFEVTVRPPRGDDPGVESMTPDAADGSLTRERRADDWLSGLREEATRP